MKKIFLLSFTVIMLNIYIYAQSWTNYTLQNSDLPGSEVRVVFIDEHGYKWFGTNNGLARLSGDTWTIYSTDDHLGNNSVNDIEYELSSYGSEIWVATDEGVTVAAFSVDGITSATTYTSENSGLFMNEISTVTVSSNNVRLFGTKKGVSIFKGDTWDTLTNGFFEDYPVISGGSSTDGWNYIGTQGGGVARFSYTEVDGVSGETIMDTDWAGLMSNNINDVFVKDTSQLYGTDDGFSYHRHHNTKLNWDIIISSLDNKLPDEEVLSVFIDSEGLFWIGTANGLTYFSDVDDENWEVFTTGDGLAGNKILDIAEDVDGNLWFATDNGVSYYKRYVGIEDLSGIEITDRLNLKVFPSPVKIQANISFQLTNNGNISLDIFDISGQLVRTINRYHLNKGKHMVKWDLTADNGSQVSTGMYLVRLSTGNLMSFKKMVVINE